MPIYDFKCTTCSNEEFDVKLTYEEFEKGYVCQNCKNKMKVKIGNTSFDLKGEGWYKDGYSKIKTNN